MPSSHRISHNPLFVVSITGIKHSHGRRLIHYFNISGIGSMDLIQLKLYHAVLLNWERPTSTSQAHERSAFTSQRLISFRPNNSDTTLGHTNYVPKPNPHGNHSLTYATTTLIYFPHKTHYRTAISQLKGLPGTNLRFARGIHNLL